METSRQVQWGEVKLKAKEETKGSAEREKGKTDKKGIKETQSQKRISEEKKNRWKRNDRKELR